MKTYQIIDKNTNITEHIIKYDIADKDGNEVYELWYSNNGHWSEGTAGKLNLTMIDDGNGFKFKPQLPKEFDYSIFNDVRILMTFQEKIKTGVKSEYRIIEEKLIAEI